MLCWHKNLDSYPNVECLQFCFEQKFTICMGLCMGKQLILVCGLGMENPPKFDFFLYFLLIHPKSDSAMTGASRYDNYSPQWGPLVYTQSATLHSGLFFYLRGYFPSSQARFFLALREHRLHYYNTHTITCTTHCCIENDTKTAREGLLLIH